jgi:hypothetical protein
MLLEGAGDQAIDVNFQDIWSLYSNVADTDSTRAAFMDVAKFLIVAFRNKESHLGDMVKHIVDILEKSGV